MSSDLSALISPRSVALIGASPNPMKWGGFMSKRLVESGYNGDIYLVATKRGEILGRQTYGSILEIEESVDLAVIGIPARFVPDAVRECIQKGVKGIVVVTAGFGETGEEGRRLERELVEMARKAGTRIVGPNCLGIYNPSIGLNTTPLSFPTGYFTFLTQSGNFAMDVNYSLRNRGLGYTRFVSLGNQMDVSLEECLQYMKDDPDTKAVLLYMEGLKNGREFLRVAKETTRNRPTVAIKVGTSAAGMRAAASHTGSLAGSSEVYDAALKQVGVIRVFNSYELAYVAEALARCPLPKNNRIAILTDGGGHGVMGSDAAERLGLEVPVLRTETQERLKSFLPPQASTRNPVDFAGGAEADLWNFVRCSEALLQDEDVGSLVIVGQYGGYGIDLASEFFELEEKVSRRLTELVGEYGKPILNHTMYEPSRPKSLRILSEGGIPVYPSVEMAMKSLSALVEYREYLERLREEDQEQPISMPEDRVRVAREVIREVRRSGRVNLVETEAGEILRAYGLPLPASKLARSGQEAVAIAEEVGFPVAMKVVSPDIIHKTEAGGVKLNVTSKSSAAEAFSEIVRNAHAHGDKVRVFGVMVTPMARSGIETIVGMTTDPTFGPTLMFGLGGIFVEILKDVSFRVAPVTEIDARRMISEIRGFPVLKGVRGQKPADIDALADVIRRVSALVTEIPEIAEMDLNPVFAYEKGVCVIDTRIILSPVR